MQSKLTSSGSSISSRVFEAQTQSSPSADQLTSCSGRSRNLLYGQPPVPDCTRPAARAPTTRYVPPQPRLVFTCPGASRWLKLQNSCNPPSCSSLRRTSAKTSLRPPVESEQPLPPTRAYTRQDFDSILTFFTFPHIGHWSWYTRSSGPRSKGDQIKIGV